MSHLAFGAHRARWRHRHRRSPRVTHHRSCALRNDYVRQVGEETLSDGWHLRAGRLERHHRNSCGSCRTGTGYAAAMAAKCRCHVQQNRLWRHQVLGDVDSHIASIQLQEGHFVASLPQRFRRRASARKADVTSTIGGKPVDIGLRHHLQSNAPISNFRQELRRLISHFEKLLGSARAPSDEAQGPHSIPYDHPEMSRNGYRRWGHRDH